MDIKAKRIRFGIIWELAFIDGDIHFLLKDIQKFFGLSKSSQGTVLKQLKDEDRIMLSGSQVKDFTHVASKGMVITFNGLIDFVGSRQDHMKRKGDELIDWMDKRFNVMNGEWLKRKEIPVQGEDSLISDPEDDPDLIDMIKEQEIDDLKQVVAIQSRRIDELENRIKTLEQGQMQDAIHRDGDKTMIDADALIKILESQKR